MDAARDLYPRALVNVFSLALHLQKSKQEDTGHRDFSCIAHAKTPDLRASLVECDLYGRISTINIHLWHWESQDDHVES